jgi:hypothetical protein
MGSPYFYIIFSLMISSAALSVVFYMAWRSTSAENSTP